MYELTKQVTEYSTSRRGLDPFMTEGLISSDAAALGEYLDAYSGPDGRLQWDQPHAWLHIAAVAIGIKLQIAYEAKLHASQTELHEFVRGEAPARQQEEYDDPTDCRELTKMDLARVCPVHPGSRHMMCECTAFTRGKGPGKRAWPAAFIIIVPLHRGFSFVTRLPSSLWYCLSRYVDIVGSCLFCLFVFRL